MLFHSSIRNERAPSFGATLMVLVTRVIYGNFINLDPMVFAMNWLMARKESLT
jgi:hypothetical protein